MKLPKAHLPSFLARPRVKWASIGSVVALAAACAVWAASALIPTKAPDAARAEVRSVAAFVMDEDFNRLPTRERISFLQQFYARFRDFNEEDAVLLAEFIAEMNRDMRQQIEENMKRLAYDYFNESAAVYVHVPPGQREAFIRNLLLEMDKLADSFGNPDRQATDEERFAAMQRQGQREREEAREDSTSTVRADRVDWLFETYNDEVAREVPATQRGNIAKLMLDLTKVRRGESLDNDGG